MNNTEFQWTEELVLEFGHYVKKHKNQQFKHFDVGGLMKNFIESKQKPLEYEILGYSNGTFIVASDSIRLAYDTIAYKIHCVKRLSDSCIFSIGDVVNTNVGRGKHRIDGFKLIDGRMCVQMKTFPTEFEYLSCVQKAAPKQPLFTTHDGVEVFEGDTYWWICADIHEEYGFTPNELKASFRTDGKFHKTCFTFSTQEAAQEYINLNKPCLSVQEVLDWYSNFYNSPAHIMIQFRNGLI